MQVSIGFIREDGDVQLLATLNNNDDLLSKGDFQELVSNTVAVYLRSVDENIIAWHRADAPDYLTFDDSFGDVVEVEV